MSRARWTAGLAVAWLLLLGAAALLAPSLPLADPLAADPAGSLIAPGPAHWLGTDLLGRDFLSRMVWGARRTLVMAALAVLLTSVSGTALGLVAAFAPVEAEEALQRMLEVALALPQLLVALVITTLLGPSPGSIALAVGLAGVAGFARLARAAALQVRGRDYLLAARALGMDRVQIAWRHVLPNLLPVLGALAGVHFAWALLNTATLTFLGFGGSPSVPDWGRMLNEGRGYLRAAPWLSAAPGLVITLTVLAVYRLSRAWDEPGGPLSR